jgi:hypothetical protein
MEPYTPPSSCSGIFLGQEVQTQKEEQRRIDEAEELTEQEQEEKEELLQQVGLSYITKFSRFEYWELIKLIFL